MINLARSFYVPVLMAFALVACTNDISSNTVRSPRVVYCEAIASAAAAQGAPAAATDPLINHQWYLDRLSVKQVWEAGFDGTGIQIGILDDALELEHEDLRQNIAVDRSLNVIRNAAAADVLNPKPVACDDAHGTAVAGIIAARGGNGLGVKGIAHRARIFGVNYLAFSTDAALRQGLTRDMNRTAISSNSWGGAAVTRLRNPVDDQTEAALNAGLNQGFGGKGISYVFAAGNHRRVNPADYASLSNAAADYPYEDLSTYEGLHNHPGVIVVCAVGFDNRSSSYSTPGANVWICGSSNAGRRGRQLENYGLATTDLSGDRAGYNVRFNEARHRSCRETTTNRSSACFDFGRPAYTGFPAAGGDANYTRFFTGTSAATPTVSGIIALLRQANSDLTWRDIKLILAESAEQVDNESEVHSVNGLGWQDAGNGHRDRNRTYKHHHDYGFGLINASAALTLARDWPRLPAYRETGYIAGQRATNRQDQQTFTFVVDGNNHAGITFVEYVQIELHSSYEDFGELEIVLSSSHGTRSVLAKRHGCLDWSHKRNPSDTDRCPDLTRARAGGWIFGTAAYLGRDPRSSWTLTVTVDRSRNAALNLIDKVDPPRIKIYGHTRGSSP